MKLTKDQDNALGAILTWLTAGRNQWLTVGGYAGTGKTTLIATARRAMRDHAQLKDRRIAFCSFTGKAAHVLERKLHAAGAVYEGDSCSTIHRLIYEPVYDADKRFAGFRTVQSIEQDVIIVDEGSMVREDIWRDLLSFEKPVLVVGDHGQLPPVGDRFNLMQDPAVTLRHIVRQEQDNPIIDISRRVQAGEDIPFGNYKDAVYKLSQSEAETEGIVDRLFAGFGETMQVLCGTNKTRVALNRRIREQVGIRHPEPQAGERVVCLKNDYYRGVYNGMPGTIERLRNDPPHWYRARVSLYGQEHEFYGRIFKHQFGRPYTMNPSRLSAIDSEIQWKEVGGLFDWGYALTVHKAQGSEAETVVVFDEPFADQPDDERRRWLYTAVTRATERLYIIAPDETDEEERGAVIHV